MKWLCCTLVWWGWMFLVYLYWAHRFSPSPLQMSCCSPGKQYVWGKSHWWVRCSCIHGYWYYYIVDSKPLVQRDKGSNKLVLEANQKTWFFPSVLVPQASTLAGFQLLSPSMNNSAINIDPHSWTHFGPKGVHVGKVLTTWRVVATVCVLKNLTSCRSFGQYLGVSPRGMVWMWSIWIWSTEPIVSVLSSTRARLKWAWIPRPCKNLQDMHNPCGSPGQRLHPDIQSIIPQDIC